MPWTFYNSSGQRLSTAATNISVLDIDGATDIGAAIVDADLFIIDDGAGGTNRKTAASRVKTYVADSGVARFFVRIAAAGTIIATSYNVDSITDTGTGNRTIVIDTDFAAITWSDASAGNQGSNTGYNVETSSHAVGSVVVTVRNTEGDALTDFPTSHVGYGAQ